MHDGTTMRMRLECGRQQIAKAIASDGSLKTFGRWILRNQLRLPQDAIATRADLQRYGREDIRFTRIGTDHDGLAVVFVDFRPL